MAITALLIVAGIFHIGFIIADIVTDNVNLTGGEANYGSEMGPLPGEGSPVYSFTQVITNSHVKRSVTVYEECKEVDLPDGGKEVQCTEKENPNIGVYGLFTWMMRWPVCTIATVVNALISMGYFNYGVVEAIPDEGFANWIKVGIQAIGGIFTIVAAARLFQMLLRSGLLTNVYFMIGLGALTLGSIVVDRLNIAILAC